MDEQSLIVPDIQKTYCDIRRSIVNAQCKIASAVNSAMVTAYWEVGERSIKPAVKMTGPSTEAAPGVSVHTINRRVWERV